MKTGPDFQDLAFGANVPPAKWLEKCASCQPSEVRKFRFPGNGEKGPEEKS